jgi:hypothetical protein
MEKFKFKPDIKEIAFKLYESHMSENFEEFKGDSPVKIGAVYMTVLNKKIVFYLLIRQLSNKYYEALKMSPFTELGDNFDIFYTLQLENKDYLIMTEVNFYLSHEEIKNSILLEEVPSKFFDELRKFYNLPHKYEGPLTRGFFYPVGNKWIRSFKEREFQVVKEYHLRIFEILDEIEEEDY